MARLGVGYVPEDRRIFRSLTVHENLLMGVKGGKSGAKGSGWTVEKIYEKFPRLRERRDNKGGHLSGGEQQMLTVARTLMGNPDLMLVDEPTEGLAPLIVKDVLEMLAAVRNSGVTVLMVEQNFKASIKVADRFYIMGKGKIVFEGDRTRCWRPKMSGKIIWRCEFQTGADCLVKTMKEVSFQKKRRKEMKKTMWGLAVMSVMLMLAMPAAAANTIKIGAMEPLSGTFKDIGERYLEGVQYAAKVINDSGGLLGKKVEVIAVDSELKPDVATRKAQNLILKDGVKFFSGGTGSSVGAAMAQLAEKQNVIMFTYGMAAASMTGEKCSKNFFRPCGNTDQQSFALRSPDSQK